jgi:methylphosphotriester-DNA--protein-cysteine methyltransferase
VLAGSDSYHRPACALVAGSQAAAVAMSRTEAAAAGLAPCRVCKPHEVAA